MSDMEDGIFSCRNICWIVGALLGLVAFLLVGGLWGLVVGVVLAVAIGLILQRMFCGDVAAAASIGGTAAAAPAATPADDAQASAQAAAEAAEAEARAAKDKAEAEKAEADAAAAKRAAEEQAAAEAELARKAEAEKAAAQARAAEEAAAAKAATPDYDGDGVQEGTAEGSRPEALSAARGGKPDDLKMIKGVGPKLEQLCNELGFYHFDQIANWTADEVAWVDANLKGFKGRVSRDGWVEQAKVLASGAETEFSKRAEDSGMYEE